MNTDELLDKWNARYRDADASPPLEVLTENAHLLPATGRALDFACGMGGSALWLAQKGFATEAWDLSDVAIERLRARADNLPLHPTVRDVEREPPTPDSFDLIVVGHFLQRDACPALAAALRPGGLLFYQTWGRERIDDSGPTGDRFRLARNELLDLFGSLVIRVYREEGAIGNTSLGFRNRVQLVAQKTSAAEPSDAASDERPARRQNNDS